MSTLDDVKIGLNKETAINAQYLDYNQRRLNMTDNNKSCKKKKKKRNVHN